MININPQKYNLSLGVKLQEDVSQNKLFIVFNRKSRIIMKDGFRIIKIAKKINKLDKNKTIGVLSSAPICSKTRNFLKENHIDIQAF